MSSGREQHQLDPNGEITLLMTRFVQYVDDSSDCQTPKDSGGTKASSHGEEGI